MGECTELFDSDEMQALKRIARKRTERTKNGPGTDYTERMDYNEYLQEVIDEFILMNGRPPKASCFE